MKRVIAGAMCLFLLIVTSGCARADWSVEWDSTSDWTTNATYENARVKDGSVDIGIYPGDSDFSGSGWTFSGSTITEVDTREEKYSGSQAYFYARDYTVWPGGPETGAASSQAENTFYLDTSGIEGATLTFEWQSYSTDFDEGDGYTTLKIRLQKPTGSWINIDGSNNIWSRRENTPSSGTSNTETVSIPASELGSSGNYTMRIEVYWYFDLDGYGTNEQFEWRVYYINFGLTRATHTSSWKDMGVTSAWQTLEASTSISTGQSITATVQVSDDQSTVKDSTAVSLYDSDYTYYITALDNARYVRVVTDFTTSYETRTPRLDNYKVTADPVPTLSSGDVTPDNGPSNTTFTYNVTYADPDGDTPSYIKVYIDGTGYDMTKITGDYTSGATYQFLTATLSKGSHSYYFTASDENSTVRLPTSGSYSGPTVGVAPSLSSGGLSPSSGNVGDTFTYEVTYTDADGDAPSYAYVYIDGSAYSMSKVSGTYTGGATYRYATSSLSTGSHTYYFTASDGTYTDTTSSASGPNVGVTSTTLSVSPSSFSVSSGGTQSLTATLTSGGSPLANKSITWTKTTGSLSASSGTTNSSGQTSVTYTAPSVSTSTGVTVTALFAGDSQYGSSSDSSSGTVSPTTTPTTFSATITFYKPDGGLLTNTAIYYGASQGAETSYLGATDSYGRITSSNSTLSGTTVYLKSSDGTYSGSTYVSSSGGTTNASLTETPGATPGTVPGAGFPIWVVAVILIVCIVGAGIAFVARKKGPPKIKAPTRKAEAAKPAEPKPEPKPALRKLDREVLGYIAEHGGKISVPGASKELEVSESEIKAALERLKRAGKLEEE